MASWIYIITNRGAPGHLKVGFTDRTPAHRVSELGATGLPFPYVVVYAVQVARGRLVEKEVHQRLSRYHASKEWFCCSVEAAKSAIREVVGNYGCAGGSPLVPGHALVPFFSGAEEMDGSPDIDEDDDDESPYPPGHPMRGLL